MVTCVTQDAVPAMACSTLWSCVEYWLLLRSCIVAWHAAATTAACSLPMPFWLHETSVRLCSPLKSQAAPVEQQRAERRLHLPMPSGD